MSGRQGSNLRRPSGRMTTSCGQRIARIWGPQNVALPGGQNVLHMKWWCPTMLVCTSHCHVLLFPGKSRLESLGQRQFSVLRCHMKSLATRFHRDPGEFLNRAQFDVSYDISCRDAPGSKHGLNIISHSILDVLDQNPEMGFLSIFWVLNILFLIKTQKKELI